MHIVELVEPEDERRDQRQTEDERRQKGLRGFYRRWMNAAQEDDDKRGPRSRRNFGWD